MSDSEYREKRVEEQIKWHSKKALHNKLRFRLCQIITLVASAIIPIINVANNQTRQKKTYAYA
jgi:hypothetical protein